MLKRLAAPEFRQQLVALTVACAFFMEMLDGSVISTALPQMARTFHDNPVNLGIGMSAYLLMLAIFIPSSGWMADRFGSKRLFTWAIVVFTVASVLCGISNNLIEFTLARMLQGVGGAMMVPVGRLVVLRGAEKRDIVNLTQFISTPGLVAPILGPPIGGFIATFSSWRWIFYLNVPIGILGLVLVGAFMTEFKIENHRPFDWSGFFLTGLGLASAMFGFDQFGRPSVDVRLTAGLLAAGAVLLAIGYVHLKRARHPLLDLSLFAIPTFAVTGLLAGTTFRIVIGATPFLWPLMFQLGFGMTAFASGALIVACAGGDLCMKTFSKRLLRKFGFRPTLVVNGVLTGLAIGLCALFTSSTPVVLMAVTLFVIGALRSVQFGSFNALTYGDIPQEKMSSATSLANTMQQLSWGLGIAFSALILHVSSFWNPRAPGQAFGIADFHVAFVGCALLAIVSGLLFSRLPKDAGEELRDLRRPKRDRDSGSAALAG